MELTGPAVPLSARVLRPEVPSIEVARNYLIDEFGKLFWKCDRENLAVGIDSLLERELWRLLCATSREYRANGVCSLFEQPYQWSEEEWNIKQLRVTEVNPCVDAFVAKHGAETVERFAQALREYFHDNPDDDPKGVGEFRRRVAAPNDSAIILRLDPNGPAIIDGIHRTVGFALHDRVVVRAFVARAGAEAPSR